MKIILASYLVLCSISISAQSKLEKEIELGNQLMFCNEPAIAINPNQTKYQQVATNTSHLFRSYKNGSKYKHQKATSSHGVYGDPVLLYNEEGTSFFVHLSKASGKEWPESFDQIVVQKSKNNGKTWNDGVGIGKNGKMQDKAWISIDEATTSPHKGNIYITWTQFDKYESKEATDSSRILFSMSHDDAESFSTPLIISDISGDCRDSDSTMEGATTATGPHGEVYALWAGHHQLFFDKSIDGGLTWGKDQSILSVPQGWDLSIPNFIRTSGLPFLVSNAEGHLYATTVLEINQKHKIVIIESKDGGKNWSEPQTLYDDADADFMMPHAYLDKKSGTLAIIYYKVKNDLVNVLISYKKKNDLNFSTVRVNQYASPVPGKQVFFGDYINVCVVDDIIAATWTEVKGISTVVKSRRIKI